MKMLLLGLLYPSVLLISYQFFSVASATWIKNIGSTRVSDTYSGSNHGNTSYYRNLPCPNAEDISPCICTYDEDFEVLNLLCDNIADEHQLYDIFHTDIPLPQFGDMRLDTSSIETLSEDVFGDSTFERFFTISDNGVLFSVDSETFIKSASTLRYLSFESNELSHFPFETLSLYSALQTFSLNVNQISSFPIIESQTLERLYLSHVPVEMIPEGALDGLPNLQFLWTPYSDIAYIPAGLFAHLNQIEEIHMFGMKLVHLGTSQFELNVTNAYINLQDNIITTVDTDAFKDIQSGEVHLVNNQLTILLEATWRPLVDAGVYLKLEGNDLTCGCDVAWLVLEPDYHYLVADARCHNGELLHQLDPSSFGNCTTINI